MSIVRLYNADCLDILPTLEAGSVDAVVTDPPYGISYSPSQITSGSKAWGGKAFVGNVIVSGDAEPFDPEPFLTFPKVALCGANHYAARLPSSPCWLVWDKRDGMAGNDFADCELIWTNLGKVARLFAHRWSGAIRQSERHRPRVHPTQKPVELMLWVFEQLGLIEGDTVFDPYMGSGTTGVACLRAGLNFIGCEIEPVHYATAERRIEAERTRHPLFAGAPD